MFNLLKKIFGTNAKSDMEQACRLAQRHIEIINESLQIANASTNPETIRSRLDIAITKITEVKDLTKKHPYIKLTFLKEVEKNIVEIAVKKQQLGISLEGAKGINLDGFKKGASIVEQSKVLARNNSDIFDGLEFHAVLNPSTPLKYLLMDGTKIPLKSEGEEIPPVKWGSWLPHIPITDRIVKNSTRASFIGPVDSNTGGKALPALIAFRTIIERPINYSEAHSFNEAYERAKEATKSAPIVFSNELECFGFIFREQVADIKHLTDSHLLSLIDKGLSCVPELKAITTKDLTNLKGIGAKKASMILEQIKYV